MFYDQDHLRITKIRTTDGSTPLLGPDERPVKKIVFAPYNKTVKKLLEEQNDRLPNGLKMKIEVIPAYKPEPVSFKPAIDEEKEALKKELEEMKVKMDALTSSQIANKETAKDSVQPGIEAAVTNGVQNGQTKQHASK